MKLKIVLILFLISIKAYSQDKATIDDLYFENHIAYKKSDGKKFTGNLQYKKRKDHIRSEEIYADGNLKKMLIYFNIYDRQVICDEFIYDTKTLQKIKHTGYSSDGLRYWETEFDENQNKKKFSFYKNNVLTIYEEFKNKKKHGKWLCINKDGVKCETEYDNGKKINSQTNL
jgi:hypothetical protein